jgi:uncharacterized protein YuzE
MEFITKYDYDEEYDILAVYWRDSKDLRVKFSEEIKTQEGNEIVIDYDTAGRIVGIEIFNFNNTQKMKGGTNNEDENKNK